MQQLVRERSLSGMKTFVPLVAFAALACPALASAQLIGTYRVRAGLGAQVLPKYPGAKSDDVSPYWTFAVAKGDKPFTFGAPGDSAGLSLFDGGGFSAGPVARLSRPREDSDVDAKVGNVHKAVELGGFVQYYPVKSLRLRAELRKALGGHDGVVGFLGADQIWRDGDKYVFSIGPRVWFGDARFERAYFGVIPEASLATGLPVYRPDRSFHAAGAVAGLQYSLSKDWGVFGYAQYQRLIGDARRSPIIRQLGSPNQFSAGIGLSHTFTIKL